MKCSVEGCDRDADYVAAMLCQKHYFRLWRHGTTDLVRSRKPYIITPNGYVRVYDPTHALADHRGYVFEHRKIVHDARGGGIARCEDCFAPVNWNTCHIDHVDNNRRNNDAANLRVTCIGCNTRRGPDYAPPTAVLLTTSAGETKNASEWARDPRVKVTARTILRRKQMGASDDAALFGRKITHKNTIPQRKPKKFVNGLRVLQ